MPVRWKHHIAAFDSYQRQFMFSPEWLYSLTLVISVWMAVSFTGFLEMGTKNLKNGMTQSFPILIVDNAVKFRKLWLWKCKKALIASGKSLKNSSGSLFFIERAMFKTFSSYVDSIDVSSTYHRNYKLHEKLNSETNWIILLCWPSWLTLGCLGNSKEDFLISTTEWMVWT